MNTYILIIGLIVAIVFFLIDKNLLPDSLAARKRLATRLEENMRVELQLQQEFEDLIKAYKVWSHTAFPNTDVTYGEYIELLKEKSNIEYSKSEFDKIQKKSSRAQFFEYIDKIKNQEEAVAALRDNIAMQRANLSSLATAS